MPNYVSGFSVLITLSYQHSLFSDKCTSSSLNCPYNIDQSVQQHNKPTFAVYRTSPPTSEQAPAIDISSVPYYETTTTVYKPSSPNYEPASVVYRPSLTYEQSSEIYKPSSPNYEPTPAVYNTSISTTPQIYNPLPTVYKQVASKEPVPPPMYITEPTKQETGK